MIYREMSLAIVNNGVVKWNLKNDSRLSLAVINIFEWEQKMWSDNLKEKES